MLSKILNVRMRSFKKKQKPHSKDPTHHTVTDPQSRNSIFGTIRKDFPTSNSESLCF